MDLFDGSLSHPVPMRGRRRDRGGGLSRAIFAYNQANWYVADVLALAKQQPRLTADRRRLMLPSASAQSSRHGQPRTIEDGPGSEAHGRACGPGLVPSVRRGAQVVTLVRGGRGSPGG